MPQACGRYARRAAALALGLAVVTIAAAAGPFAYPPAPRGDVTDDYHGTVVADPYRWLEDLDSDATRRWVDAQDRISSGYLASLPGRRAIRDRLRHLHDFEYIATPFREGGRTFYTRAGGRLGQPVLMMRSAAGATPAVALDPNTLSADGHLAVVGYVPSPDGRRLAYGVCVSGSDWTDWHVRDLDTGRDLPDVLRNTKYYHPVFAHDGHGLYYSAFPPPPRGAELTTPDVDNAVYYHALGAPSGADVRLFAVPGHPDWQYEPSLSDDGRWLVAAAGEGEVGDKNRENLYALDLHRPGAAPVTLVEGFDAAYLYVGSGDGALYFLTSLAAPRGRVISIDPSNPAREAWREVVAEGPDAIEFTAGKVVHVNHGFVVATLHDAASRLTVYGADGARRAEIPLPGAGTVTGLAGHAGDTDLYYSFSNLVTPPTVYRYAFADGIVHVESAPRVAFDRDAFEQRQVFYPARDGTRIPMLLAYRKGLKLDGHNPLLLYAYGGFGIAVMPTFSDLRIPWLEMGGIYAIANVRGGGEYGEAWHRAGIQQHRQTVFDDFAAAAAWLVGAGYTNRDRLAIHGGSNGGLLVGVSLTQHPERYGAVVANVGVLDMLRFDRYGQGAGWIGDYGSPQDPAQFAALYAYSPVHRVTPGARYPPTLIVTGDHDTRVHPMHSFKFAAALQAAQAGSAPVLLDLERSSGHAGGTTSSQRVEQSADLYAFLADALKMQVR
jgi:prolyl oligopeptidase